MAPSPDLSRRPLEPLKGSNYEIQQNSVSDEGGLAAWQTVGGPHRRALFSEPRASPDPATWKKRGLSGGFRHSEEDSD